MVTSLWIRFFGPHCRYNRCQITALYMHNRPELSHRSITLLTCSGSNWSVSGIESNRAEWIAHHCREMTEMAKLKPRRWLRPCDALAQQQQQQQPQQLCGEWEPGSSSGVVARAAWPLAVPGTDTQACNCRLKQRLDWMNAYLMEKKP